MRADFFIELKNPSEDELLLKTDICMIKKQKIIDHHDQNKVIFKVEAQFTDLMKSKIHHFKDYEAYKILLQHIVVVLNMQPITIQDVLGKHVR